MSLSAAHNERLRNRNETRNLDPGGRDDTIASDLPESGIEGEDASVRHRKWVSRVEELERFIELNGRWPRTSARQPAERRSPSEERLANWIRYQRRNELALGDDCAKRLESISGFSWEPREERWKKRLDEYVDFLAREKRRPSRRAQGRHERSLAVWRDSQSALERAGRLPLIRIQELRRCQI